MLRALFVIPLLAAGLAFAQEPPPAGDAPPPSPEEVQKLLDQMMKEQEKAQDDFNKAIGLRKGPMVGEMGVASINVPAGMVWTDGNGAKEWGRLTTNPVSGKEIGLIGPENGEWLVLFEFDDVGYVKDDEKDDLDADELLESFKQANDAFNEERVRAGVPPMTITGWEQKPAYNEAAHSLEWCIRAESGGRPNLNFNTRLLGRRGVVSVTLIFGGELTLAQVLPGFREMLQGFTFKTGETYAEYKDGDKLAEYGLAALVAGGGVAVAAKTGLLSKLGVLLAKGGKLVIVAVVAVVGGLASLFKKLAGRRE